MRVLCNSILLSKFANSNIYRTMKMAKFKIWMVALTLIMGVSFTSCFDSSDDNTQTGIVIGKVHSSYGLSYYFETADGKTVTPTTASITEMEAKGVKFSELSGKLVQIAYMWDSSVLEIPSNATKIEGVSLTYIADLSGQVEVVTEPGAANDSISDTPIVTLKKEASSVFTYEPYFFDRSTLVLPVIYYLYSKPHSFTLVYYPNEENTDGIIKLYLRHKKNGDNMSTSSPVSLDFFTNSLSYLYFYYSFDLQKILYSTAVTSLDKVIVVTEENANSVKLDDSNTKTNEYIVEYKEIK